MKLIVLNYVDRSGSTYLANQISRYPEILVFPEVDFFSGYLLKNPHQQFKADKSLKRRISILTDEKNQLNRWQLKELINTNWSEGTANIDVFLKMLSIYAEKYNSKAGIWVFKQPNMFSFMENYKKLKVPGFEIKYICIIRDPRAVFNSQLKASRDFPNLTFYKNPLLAANTWLYFYNKAKSFSSDSDFYFIYYEQLLSRYKKEFSSLMRFIGIDINSNICKQKGNLYEILTESEKRLHSKINNEADILRVDAWKEELKPLMIRLIDRHTLEKEYVPEYKKHNSNVNILVRLSAEIYYKMRIFLKVDRY